MHPRFPRAAGLAIRLALVAVFCGLVGRLGADPVGFPQDRPVFTLGFPANWNLSFDAGSGSLTARPLLDTTVLVTVLTLDGVKDEKAARRALPRIVEQIAKNTGLTGLRKGEIASYKTEKNLRCFHLEAKGRDPYAGETVLTAIAFSPDDELYYLFVSSAPAEAEKLHEDELVGIVHSIEGSE